MRCIPVDDLKAMRRDLIELCEERPELLKYAQSGSRWRPESSKAAENLKKGSGNLLRRVERQGGDVLTGGDCTLAMRYIRELRELRELIALESCC